MNVYRWTKQQLLKQFPDTETLGELFRQVELDLGQKNQVVCQFKILENGRVEIPKMIDVNDRLAQDFRFQGVEGRLRAFVSLIDSCQLLVDSLMTIDNLLANSATVQADTWKNAERNMATGIGEALQAFQKKDYTLLADVLEYDLGHSLQSWQELLGQLMVEVNNDTEADASNSALGG
jgi:hypothetical protein